MQKLKYITHKNGYFQGGDKRVYLNHHSYRVQGMEKEMTEREERNI